MVEISFAKLLQKMAVNLFVGKKFKWQLNISTYIYFISQKAYFNLFHLTSYVSHLKS